ncbi:MAG: hypothetical protein RR804_18030, partial [Massilia sp.]
MPITSASRTGYWAALSFLTADTLFLSTTNDIAVVEQSGVSNIIGPDVPVDVRCRRTGARVQIATGTSKQACTA